MGGTFFADPMTQADAYLLMNILHDWPDAESVKILSAIRRDMFAACLCGESLRPSFRKRLGRTFPRSLTLL